MRIWIDLTNSPHVPLFAPLVRRMRAAGHTVELTARDFAQTLELAQLHELEVTQIGHHGGASRWGKARTAISRTLQMYRHGRRLRRSGTIDLAISHGSTDLPPVCRLLGIPHTTMFDYEWATTMHRLNCRLSTTVVTPDAIPPERLEQYGASRKLRQYPGLKEEYYLADSSINADRGHIARLVDDAVGTESGIGEQTILAILRPPPELALYHRGRHNDLFDELLRRLSADERVVTVVLARTREQQRALPELPRVHAPERAVPAQDLIASADVMISAGGTMNREAVALGTPVYTVFAGRMGAVDEHLIAEGRLHQLARAADVQLQRVAPAERPGLRDPQDLIDLLLAT